MTDINTVTVIGRLTKDAEVHTFDNGSSVFAFSVAVNTSKKEGDKWVDEANFFSVKYYAKKIDALKSMLVKGTQVCVTGHLKQDRWEKDGQKNSQVVIMADVIQTCGGKKSESNDSGFHEDMPF